MIYETYGEFEVPREQLKGKKALNLTKETLNNFWNMVDQKRAGLSGACGCYIFAIKAGKGRTPWYVGQSKGPFKDECFAFHKERSTEQLLIVCKALLFLSSWQGSHPKGNYQKLSKSGKRISWSNS